MTDKTTRALVWGIGSLLLAACHQAEQPPTQTPASILPLKTLRLYETGVGYFERTGGVAPAEGTALPVPAGHLDDALKSLVVLGADKDSRVHGLEFRSSVTKGMGLALAGLSPDSEGPISYRQLLTSLKGDAVELRTAEGVVSGRLIDVKQPAAGGPQAVGDETDGAASEPAPATRPDLEVLLLTDAAEIRRFDAGRIISVRPRSEVTAARLGLALDTVSARNAQTQRRLRILADSPGDVTLGYVAETPIWRTTYRLVLEEAADETKAMLQGWALLHNDTDEHWRGVQVHLVSGQPDSFLYPLAAPRYSRRELIAPDQTLSTIPQLLDNTADALWGDFASASGAMYGDSIGESYGAGGFGMGHGRAPMVRMGSASLGTTSSAMLNIGNLASVVEAQGTEAPALFTYSFPQTLDLRAHGSALVPFLQRPIEVRRISWIEGSQARSAVRLVNSTGQTLPTGPVAFFSAGGFVGESGLDRLKPAERQIISFGVDLDIESTTRTQSTREEIKRLSFDGNYLATHFVRHTTEAIQLKNRGGLSRVVFYPLDVVTNAKVSGADELDFDAGTSKPIAVFKLGASQQTGRKLSIEQGLSRTSSLTALTSDQLTALAETITLPDAERAVVRAAATKLQAYEQLDEELAKKGRAIQLVETDLRRLRKHLEAMGSRPAAGTNPFVTRILAAEDQLSALRSERASAEEQKPPRLEAVRTLLRQLSN